MQRWPTPRLDELIEEVQEAVWEGYEEHYETRDSDDATYSCACGYVTNNKGMLGAAQIDQHIRLAVADNAVEAVLARLEPAEAIAASVHPLQPPLEEA